jgi:A/G-specific adenine glycosylase
LVDLLFPAEKFVERLLVWYGQSGRDLPWRNTRDPYRIWLSEIMLQQTTVAAVSNYYQRFLEHFPSVESLAAAPMTAVIDLWAGLGYYTRARNLHSAAKIVVDSYSGDFPADVEALQALPGIGRSTAGAILALAFDQQAPILDANVRRVLCRIGALQQPPRSTDAEKQLWHWSEQLTPLSKVHDYTQAIMDLGAMVCVPRQPLCEECPVLELCQAHDLGLEQQLPLKQVKKKLPNRHESALLINVAGRYLARRRMAEGFLGGLWEFPSVAFAEDDNSAEKAKFLLADFGLEGQLELLGSVRHTYSHFHLESSVYHVSVDCHGLVTEGENHWFSPEKLSNLALHGAHKKVLAKIYSKEK